MIGIEAGGRVLAVWMLGGVIACSSSAGGGGGTGSDGGGVSDAGAGTVDSGGLVSDSGGSGDSGVASAVNCDPPPSASVSVTFMNVSGGTLRASTLQSTQVTGTVGGDGNASFSVGANDSPTQGRGINLSVGGPIVAGHTYTFTTPPALGAVIASGMASGDYFESDASTGQLQQVDWRTAGGGTLTVVCLGKDSVGQANIGVTFAGVKMEPNPNAATTGGGQPGAGTFQMSGSFRRVN